MASREELLQSIHPQMKFDKAFFLKIYGFEVSFPGFAETAISKFEKCGCCKAMEHYNKVVSEYQKKHADEMDKAAHWFRQECEKEWQKKQRGDEGLRKPKPQNRNQKWKELSQILGFQ